MPTFRPAVLLVLLLSVCASAPAAAPLRSGLDGVIVSGPVARALNLPPVRP